MASNVIPKEQQTAYQRWELASFGDDRPAPAPQDRTQAAGLVDQIKKASEQARRAAYAVGLEEGRGAGFEQGRAAGLEQGRGEGFEQGRADGLAQAEEETRQLQRIAAGFGDEVAQASERIATDVLDLALDLARAMLGSALAVRPELVLPVVSDAIRHLPAVQQPARLFLHPADALLVRERMGGELDKSGWQILEDDQMERGGCRVETAGNQIDASAATRWQRIAAALGKESDWLAP
jgi:flagellar assembly protein FliH